MLFSFAALLKSADSSIITGDFPPNSKVTEQRFSAADFITFSQSRTSCKENMVKRQLREIRCYWWISFKTATSFTGNISANIFFIKAVELGVCSDGFIITQLPAAMAETNGPKVKLKREIPRRNNQNDALRFIVNVRRSTQKCNRNSHIMRFHPSIQMFYSMINFVGYSINFG